MPYCIRIQRTRTTFDTVGAFSFIKNPTTLQSEGFCTCIHRTSPEVAAKSYA